MFSGNAMFLPGQELRDFEVGRPEARGSENGREGLTGGFAPLGKVRAILAQAKPEEIQRWRQLGHPVTHKIIMRGRPPFDARPGDAFEMDECGRGRRFYCQTLPYDVGGLGHWTIFHCDERGDVS